ncbi:MAG: hypothetical protein J2P48_20970, partial [Alphaproteobacteria bacterium]|nr:hypothetical protein [Alphaproteobacteria bacterium]
PEGADDHPHCTTAWLAEGKTAHAALRARLGDVLSTLLIASDVWFAGVAVAAGVGHVVDTAASVALGVFGT